MISRPATTSELRTANEERVVRAIRADGTLSQAEIASRTQLAPPTVSGIVRDLVARGFLRSEEGMGRRGSRVTISQEAGVVAGVDVGHSHLEVSVADLGGNISRSRSIALSPDTGYRKALELANALMDETLLSAGHTREKLRALGLAVPAPIGVNGTLDSGLSPSGWVGADVKREAEAVFHCPTLVDNDANLGALAESTFGAGRGHDDLLYIKLGTGVGGGFVLGGQVYRGGLGIAGELGHFTIDEYGPLCRCGNRGCLEAYVGGSSLLRQYAQVGEAVNIASLVASAVGGDSSARRLIEDAGRHLGKVVSVIVNLLGLSIVVVGGELSEAGDLLLDEVRASLRRNVIAPLDQHVQVLASTVERQASSLGCVLLALDAVEFRAIEPSRRAD